MKEGQPVIVQFPDGWREGYQFERYVGATDRPYRVYVTSQCGRYILNGIAPECVRPAS